MSSARVSEGDLVGLSALLYTLKIHHPLTKDELIATCMAYGLRGGAVSWDTALRIAEGMKLVWHGQGGIGLTTTGASIGSLVTQDLEPSDEFARAVLTFSIGRSAGRFTLTQVHLDGDALQDPRGVAGPVLDDLADVGLVARGGTGEWELQPSDFNPLLVGLLLAGPKGTSLASEVGSLGEALTLKYYLEIGWEPLHVSPISDVYGFDVLCRQADGAPSLAVEAKGTTGVGPYRFFASRHEMRVAGRLGQRYEIALWGEIDPAQALDHNYGRLRARGFPRLIRDPYGHVETHLPGTLSGRELLGGSISADGLVWHVV